MPRILQISRRRDDGCDPVLVRSLDDLIEIIRELGVAQMAMRISKHTLIVQGRIKLIKMPRRKEKIQEPVPTLHIDMRDVREIPPFNPLTIVPFAMLLSTLFLSDSDAQMALGLGLIFFSFSLIVYLYFHSSRTKGRILLFLYVSLFFLLFLFAA